jgi:outer membrane protein TolC
MVMFGKSWILAGVVILLPAIRPAVASAAEVAADSVAPRTLDEYLSLARDSNATTRVASSRALASRERVGVVTGYPDPRLMYGYYTAPDAMQGRQEFLLLQEIPFPGKRGLRGEIASREAGMAARMADAVVLDVELDVKIAFYQYVGLSETARVLETESDLLRRMRDVAQVRYGSGTAEQQDVLKVELTLSRLADETSLNAREVAATRARLNELIGREATSPLPDPVWVMPDASLVDRVALADSALARRPEIAGAHEEIALADAARRLAKREYLPNFMLGVNYEFGGRNEDWWELMVGIDLPIWIGKRRAMAREAEAMQTSAAHGMRQETLRMSREVTEATERTRTARERLERYKTSILPQAEAAFASSEASYRTGRVDFLDYLDSERMLLEMRKDYAMVIADLGMQLAALERAIGLDHVQKQEEGK